MERFVLPKFLILLTIFASLVLGGVVKRADDVNADLQSLQVMMQQQASVITTLQAKMAAVEGKVESLSKSGK
jgi:hypothetical protein